MKTVVFALLLVGCAPAVAAPSPTEDPRIFSLQTERDILAARLATPEFVMWSTSATLRAGQFFALGLPDTFRANIHLTATTAVRARIMSFDEYAKYRSSGLSTVVEYGPAVRLDITFHDAEGCGAYVLVLDAAQETTITPNVTITHVGPHPPTGVCAP